ncbi:MAG: hypothetical protein DRP66_05760 [Planctomycetota bacterium]|nr:MAG: hypothetical protein DRP66_05760 [Planctomycetota bacterium]
MKPTRIAQLVDVLKKRIPNINACSDAAAHADAVITAISTDSRTVKPADCFFAIEGDNFDGHDFLDRAVEKGARCVITQKRFQSQKAAVLRVDDTIKALGDLARWYRRQLPAKVIAITGSAGKTTTRQIAFGALKECFKCHQSPKSFNNNIGLPLTILAAEPEHEFLIVELGSNAAGEISYLTRIAQPDIALITNIYPAHLAGFGCIENIVREKASISEGLAPEAVLLINGDFEELVAHCRDLGVPYATFGKSPGCDIIGSDFVSRGMSGQISVEGKTIDVPIAGSASLENTLAAWAVCKHAGLSVDDFARAVKTFEAGDMRLEISKVGPLTVIDDCYNANPASMKNAVDCLMQIARVQPGRTVFICGQMAELGKKSRQHHARLGRLIASAGVEVLLAAGPFARTTANAAQEKADADFEFFVFDDTESLCNNLVDIIRRGDIILIKGSRSARLEKATEKLQKLVIL